ncbi:MAG TPA: hypothetical protein VK745_04010 [Polyangiaceae bacterium]|nr:hypothetical protein [Polyangiaceae bacterium]
MDCAEIRQGFLTGEVPSGSSVDEHLKCCPHCGELFLNDALLGRRLSTAAPEVPETRRVDAQLAVAESAILRERGVRAYLRSRSTRVRWALLLAGVALLLLGELVLGRVPWRSFTPLRLSAGVVLAGLLALVTRAALRPLPVERRAARRVWLLACVAWGLPCLLWFAPEVPTTDFSGNFGLRSLACFAYGSLLGVPSFALLWAFHRGTAVPFRVLALAAGTVALAANLLLLFHCPLTNRSHLAAGHFTIGLAWFLGVSLTEWGRRYG